MLNMWIILITLFGIIKERSVVSTDPCQEGNYRILTNIGSRNEWCVPSEIPLNDLLCDQYLTAGWYTASNAIMLNRAPVSGSCGVDSAAWLKDPFPNADDGIVNRTICIMDAQDTCFVDFLVQIKHCSTFYVYYMEPLPDSVGCPAAYCFNSRMTCLGEPMSSTISHNTTLLSSSIGQKTFTPTIKSVSSSIYNDSVTSTVSHNPSSTPSSLHTSTPEVGSSNNESEQQNNQVALYALSASLAVSICIIAVLVLIYCCVLKRRKSEGDDSYQGDYTFPNSNATTSNIYDTLDQDQAKMKSKGADSYEGTTIPTNAHASTGNIYVSLDQGQATM